MIVFARDSNRKNKAVPADPGCTGIPGFPYTPVNAMRHAVVKRVSARVPPSATICSSGRGFLLDWLGQHSLQALQGGLHQWRT